MSKFLIARLNKIYQKLGVLKTNHLATLTEIKAVYTFMPFGDVN
jgi:hypothetical protein